ncbi:hypothetical protein BR93DRAFT_967471 [Coniochaeta sp. PMI_546]|nr:hypothetical protein BR93DRAFT_967471 [Coniochaeta sp. PMI_546]
MADHPAAAAEGSKRKRGADDGNSQLRRSWILPLPKSASEPSIQYLLDSSLPRLELLPGDCPELTDIIRTIDAYENVLGHHESLAARLGAQLTSPKLVKALESLFEGAIATVDQFSNGRPQPSWMEVIAFAKANPDIFVLTRAADGTRCCRFTIRHFLCTIGENDWRLIVSGAVDRFGLVPIQGTPEDEAAELATVEILDERLQTLILNADKLAEKARQLKYRLGGRKAGIESRRPSTRHAEGSATITQALHPGYNLKEDLLCQLTTIPQSTLPTLSASQSPQVSENHDDSPSPHFVHELMYSRVENLPKGGLVFPRCDLCRKRNKDCIKNATACEACTKKHAKCTWHNLTVDEASGLMDGVNDVRVTGAAGPVSQDSTSGSTHGRGTAATP